MKFKDVELLPGVIVDVADPKMLGRIKCVVPGLFDTSTMDKEGMPWIYPISMIGYQGFSKLQEGSKVWVFVQEGNYREFWYMPMFEAHTDTREIISDYDEPDVLISRSAGANSVYVYYTDKQGIMLKLGDDTYINIKANGEILAKSSEGQISIRDNKVYIGDKDAKEPAILGDQLYDVLNKLASDLNNLSSLCSPPYTSPLAPGFIQASSNLSQGINKIKCENTLVS